MITDKQAPIQEEIRTPAPRARQSRPYVYELDPLRATTALVVIVVHVLAFTAMLNHTTLGLQIQNALVVAVHYTREMFMFVTTFALVYVYYGKPFSATRFWKKRTIGVLVPYCIWSIFYVWFNHPHLSLGAFVQTSLLNLLTGNSSYQMYYILLTLQFYILFPLFLPLMSILKKYPWQALAISFLLEVLVLYNGSLVKGDPPITQWLQEWAQRDDCKQGPIIFTNTRQVTGERWMGCRDDAILNYAIHGLGHAWPTAHYIVLRKGQYATSFDATTSIWAFFQDYKLQFIQRTFSASKQDAAKPQKISS